MVWTRVNTAQMKKDKGRDKITVQIQPARCTNDGENGGQEGDDEAGFQVRVTARVGNTVQGSTNMNAHTKHTTVDFPQTKR